MRVHSLFILVTSSLLLVACNWVPLKPEAKVVRVLAADASTAGCQKRGEIGVTVKRNVAFYERNPLRVRDELETQARNDALGLGANAVQPMTEPLGGSQWFSAWQCPGR
ncbi:MAG: DUF4156 domain-containing protein [Xanthomonadaceae bacterium]|jgi:hypothetical protein|nr:DUF4156 domain-containing protein [Xanthomonadaceae bacterium]